MSSKDIEGMIAERNNGKSVKDISLRFDMPGIEVKKMLVDKMGDDFYNLNLPKVDNPERLQKMVHSRLIDIIEDYHEDYEKPSKSHKFIKIKSSDPRFNIGVDVKATYYESVVKSAWRYKKYHEMVDKLYIILISRRIKGERLEELKNDMPDNVIIIPYEDSENIEELKEMLMKKR